MYRVSSYFNTSESLGERKMLWENLIFCLPTLSRLMQLFFISSISITPSHSIEKVPFKCSCLYENNILFFQECHAMLTFSKT